MISPATRANPLLMIGKLSVIADPSGALFAPDEGLLIVSDLHFEKGSSLARRGSMLPPYDSRDTLLRLSAVIDRLKPKSIIALGDTWHDRHGHDRMSSDDLDLFATLRRGIDWILITGNHDPDPPRDLGASVLHEIEIAGVTFRHEPNPQTVEPEIAGHLHPAAKIRGKGRSIRRKCFISNKRRCILPAFGTYTGGLNVLDTAFIPLFPMRDFVTHIVSTDQIYAVGPHSLVTD